MTSDNNLGGARVPVELLRQAVTQMPGRSLGDWREDFGEPDARQGLRLIDYWRVLLKHKWVIAIALAFALAIGLGATLLTKPVYTASTTVEIDRQAADVVGLQDIKPETPFSGADAEFLETQYGLLKSRSLAERVAQSLDLAHDDRFLAAVGIAAGTVTTATSSLAMFEHVVGNLQDGLVVSPVPSSRLVVISFSGPEAPFAAKIANAFADNFIAANLERRFEASSYARHFLEQHLAQLKTKLADSERQLVAYSTQQHIIEVGGSPQGKDAAPPQSLTASNLAAFNAALAAAKANMIQAKQKWLAAQQASDLSVPEALADPTIGALRQQRATLDAEYENQLRVYKPDYPAMLQLKARLEDIDSQLRAAAGVIRNALKIQYDTAFQQESALQAQVDELSSSMLDLDNREIQLHILQREADTNRTLYEGLLQRYKEIGVAGGVTTNNVSIVDRAQSPGAPSAPRPLRNMIIAALSGLGLGVLMAFLLEALDQAIRSPADVESKLGLAVLGTVPLVAKGLRPIDALADVRSPLSEAYYSIRSTLAFSTKDGAPRTLAVTSVGPEEGKTTTALALAQGFARLGQRVLLIDLDLRNPSIHKLLGMNNGMGVSNLLTGSVRLEEVVQPSEWPNLYVVVSGPPPPSPAELLASPRLRLLNSEGTKYFDIVILDAPPVMGLADAPLIAATAVGTIAVIESGRTMRGPARAAIRRLRMTHAHLIGAILTKLDARQASYGYGYAYEYEYTYGQKRKGVTAELPLLSKQRKPPSAA